MIHGQGIDLRLVCESDLESLSDLWAEVDARGDYYPRNLTSKPVYKRRYEDTGFWSDEYGAMVIVTHEDEILGQIAYYQAARYLDALEIAYIVLRPGQRGKGVMSEALRLFSAYLFETKKINRLQLTVVPGNVASKRVAEKAGFQSEGIMRGAIFQRGRNQDLELFSLLRSEWLERSQAG